ATTSAGDAGGRRRPHPDEQRRVEIFRRASARSCTSPTLLCGRTSSPSTCSRSSRAPGSGFVCDTNGHIVTNFHVIDGGDSFKVRLADQSEYAAKVGGI